MEAASALECCNIARKLWLNSRNESDLNQVEQMYLQAMKTWSNKAKKNCGDELPNKLSKTVTMTPFENREEYAIAGEKLALLLCQSGRANKVKKGLNSLGYVCRLSSSVLDYPLEQQQEEADIIAVNSMHDFNATENPPCIIVDNFLSSDAICYLKSIFEDSAASYWSDHAYQVEPPSPYFSYAFPIDQQSLSSYGFLGELVNQVYCCTMLRSKFPNLCEAKYVEIWAHNRPHASGHQMHFDSDDEGRAGVRNPVVSTILYVTAGSGGPSLITSQVFGDIHLAEKGWLCHPKEKRLVAFDGRVLHGVVPGKKFSSGGKRVTLMFAFWKDLCIRQEKDLGSSRPIPTDKSWAQKLKQAVNFSCKTDHDCSTLIETLPLTVDRVYETLEGKLWSKEMGMPSYDQVFQGF